MRLQLFSINRDVSSQLYGTPSNASMSGYHLSTPASYLNHSSLNVCALSPLTYRYDSFNISNCPDVGGRFERKDGLESSWEYSSLHLSPDMTERVGIEFEDLET